jgi:hypothetical protein
MESLQDDCERERFINPKPVADTRQRVDKITAQLTLRLASWGRIVGVRVAAEVTA